MATKPDIDFVSDVSRPSNHNYLSSNFFRLSIGRAPTVAYFAQQVSLPSISLLGLEQPTTLSTTVKLPGNSYQFSSLLVNFLVDEEMRGWKEIYDWITTIANLTSTENTVKHKDRTSDIVLYLTNSSYKEKFEIKFIGAYPESLSEIPLSIQQTDNVPFTARVSFRYTYYEFKALTSV
jgi:hypothetical protein